MEQTDILRELLPPEIVDNFDIVRYKKTKETFDIWFDEKKIQEESDAGNANIIAYGFGDYKSIQDFPLRGRFTRLHLRKRKWLDKSTGEIFSYSIDTSEYVGTRLNAEFVAFLKEDC